MFFDETYLKLKKDLDFKISLFIKNYIANTVIKTQLIEKKAVLLKPVLKKELYDGLKSYFMESFSADFNLKTISVFIYDEKTEFGYRSEHADAVHFFYECLD